jgi:hypothetical protein
MKKESSPLADEEKAAMIQKKADALFLAAQSSDLDSMHKKVAWILNRYPEARDSDIALQLAFWDNFEPEFSGEYVHRSDLYKFARLTSLSRARATIQNKYNLFVASPGVRQQRGKLSEEERQKIVEQRTTFPSLVVYADESGKQSKRLVVGSVWFLHPPTLITVENAIRGLRKRTGYEAEFHFSTITNNNLHRYLELADLLAKHTSVLSFVAATMARSGVDVDHAIGRLYYHLTVLGVEHEDETGRAKLPRSLNLTKDAEEAGRDGLLLLELDDQLKQAAASRFHDQFSIDRLSAGDSASHNLLQIADLYAGSLNRVLEHGGSASNSAKDGFAAYFLDALKISTDPSQTTQDSDNSVHLYL